MEASLNVTEIVDVNDLPKELGSCPEKYNIADKTYAAKQKTSVSGKRSEKRNGKLSKNKCDIFSIKAGLSSFRSSAGGNSVLGIYGSKRDICDFAKHVDEVSLNELLDGSYKCPDSIKVKEQSTEGLNGSFLLSVREACSVLHLQKPAQTPADSSPSNKYTVEVVYQHFLGHMYPEGISKSTLMRSSQHRVRVRVKVDG
ncbi:hypothetical protein HanHA300_Chr06g0197791 [Helianthus annuus]|nr:hypothetical protein HanHA300_Chr06g0197791 [Helianthus annuus]KAJ0736614.1 hypothetical protein HanLR1_Chr06g0197851 [Helianthus annuus]